MNLKNMTILGLILFGMYVSSNVFACKDATSLLFQYAQEFAALETLSAPSCPYKLDPSDLTIKYFLIGDKIKKTILTLNSNDRFIFERFLDMYLAVHTEFVQSKSKSKRKELYTKAAEIVSNIFSKYFLCSVDLQTQIEESISLHINVQNFDASRWFDKMRQLEG